MLRYAYHARLIKDNGFNETEFASLQASRDGFVKAASSEKDALLAFKNWFKHYPKYGLGPSGNEGRECVVIFSIDLDAWQFKKKRQIKDGGWHIWPYEERGVSASHVRTVPLDDALAFQAGDEQHESGHNGMNCHVAESVCQPRYAYVALESNRRTEIDWLGLPIASREQPFVKASASEARASEIFRRKKGPAGDTGALDLALFGIDLHVGKFKHKRQIKDGGWYIWPLEDHGCVPGIFLRTALAHDVAGPSEEVLLHPAERAPIQCGSNSAHNSPAEVVQNHQCQEPRLHPAERASAQCSSNSSHAYQNNQCTIGGERNRDPEMLTISTLTSTDTIPFLTDLDPLNGYNNLWAARKVQDRHDKMLVQYNLYCRVIDGENVGYSYGSDICGWPRWYEIEGVKRAAKHFLQEGIEVIIVTKRGETKQLLQQPPFGDNEIQIVLADRTDDVMIFKVAQDRNCPIVSRDGFAEWKTDRRLEPELRKWLTSVEKIQVRFSWGPNGQFLPDFDLPRPVLRPARRCEQCRYIHTGAPQEGWWAHYEGAQRWYCHECWRRWRAR